MARRKKTSPFEDLIFIASRLPWWVSLLIALATGLYFHSVAISPAPTAIDPKNFGPALAGQMWRSFALFLQYIVPIAFVLGAVGSVIGRAKRRQLMEDVATATQPGKTIEGISWQQFEQLVGEAFRRQGFSVTETGGNGPDGGIDLILRKGTEKHLVQCKKWKATKVGVAVVREFFGLIAAEGAAGGFVVTPGTFTDDAKAFASGRNIRLVEGAELKRWISASRSLQAKLQVITPVRSSAVPVAQASAPGCPVCSSAMQKRTAKRGTNAGNEFWGCSQYPKCRVEYSGTDHVFQAVVAASRKKGRLISKNNSASFRFPFRTIRLLAGHASLGLVLLRTGLVAFRHHFPGHQPPSVLWEHSPQYLDLVGADPGFAALDVLPSHVIGAPALR